MRGVRITSDERARVPLQCISEEGQSFLIYLVIEYNEKGKQVNIPVLFEQRWQHKAYFRRFGLVKAKYIQFKLNKTAENGNHEKQFKK